MITPAADISTVIPRQRPAPNALAATAGRRRIRVRRVAGMIYLLASCGVVFVALLIPGLIRTEWKPLMVMLCIVAGGCALLLRKDRLSARFTVPLILYADVSITVYALVHADAVVARAALVLLVLPTLYVALFHGGRALVGQSLVVTAASAAILARSGLPGSVVALQTLQVLLAAASPTASVLILRRQLERSVRRSQRMASTDPLTGLSNRRGLDETFPGLVARARALRLPVGVLVADVDHFKRVNDELGHAVGDQVLRQVAATTLTCVPAGSVVARLGGEEIAVVAVLDVDGLCRLAERVRERVEAEGTGRGITVSLGVAWEHLPDPPEQAGPVQPPDRADGPDPDAGDPLLQALLARADVLMYEAKRAGRNRVRVPA